jgi:hypothetical protein
MQNAAPGFQTEDDICAEGERLARAAGDAGVPLALLGGVAIWLRCPSMRKPPLQRSYNDLDIAITSSGQSAVKRFLEEQGYVPDRKFNALHGASRLIYLDATRGRHLDVIVDRFVMCHTLDLRRRIEPSAPTLPLVDLLLTKLQIVELNEKDLRDILGLLADHAVGPAPDDIDPGRIAAVTRDDWGLEHTVRRTLTVARERAGWPGLPEGTTETIRQRMDEIVDVLERSPKGMRWKMRARIGERLPWYELPEEAH